MPGWGALVVLLGSIALLSVAARIIASRAADPRSMRVPSDAGPRTVVGASVGAGIAVAAASAPHPLYVTAAAVAALSTAAATGLASEISAAYGTRAYRIPSLASVEPEAGSLTAPGAVAAVTGACVIAFIAFQVRMIGPSDAGLIALAAVLGVLFEHWLRAAWRPSGALRRAPTALSALVAAALAVGFVVLLP